MNLTLVTSPTVEPVTLDEAKDHLRLSGSDDDAMVTALILSARELAEQYTERAFVTQSWKLTLDSFPSGPILLHKCPVQRVTAIKYVDSVGHEQTLDPSLYQVDVLSEPARIRPAYLTPWPTALWVQNAVTVEFDAGYGDTANKVPEIVKLAMKLQIGYQYENREGAEKPPLDAFHALLNSRKYRFA